MPYTALKRFDFGDETINVGQLVPIVEGRDYRKMERLGLITWSKDGADAPASPAVNPAPPATDTAIPENWRDLPWMSKTKGDPTLRSFAMELGVKSVKNKAEAIAAIEAVIAARTPAPVDDKPADEPVAIPDDWAELEGPERVALANSLKVVEDEIVDAEEADAVIELEIESRKAKANGQPA